MQALADEELKHSESAKEVTYMKCPFCSHHIAASWQPLSSASDELGRNRSLQHHISTFSGPRSQHPQKTITVTANWLICQNLDCREIIVQVARNIQDPQRAATPPIQSETWLACPKRSNPPALDPLIPESLRKDYIEAWNILDDSWRMSAVLARRILSDILEKYDSATQFSLDKRIEAFIAKPQHPTRLKENLQYLREIGNFAAHTQVQQNPPIPDPPIIDVSKEEAEWTLKTVVDLFDYFIVAPEQDRQMRTSFSAKITAAGRKPI